jgi:hypothetical protein
MISSFPVEDLARFGTVFLMAYHSSHDELRRFL